MLALVVSLMMVATTSPHILTVPIIHPDPREVWLDELQRCENENHVKRIIDTNGYYSYGDFMFQMGTWLSYGKEFGATRANIGNNNLQRVVARDMLDKGGWRHWFNCGKKVTKKLGYSYKGK